MAYEYIRILNAITKLKSLLIQGNKYAKTFIDFIIERLHKTASFPHLVMTCVFSREGKNWFDKLPLTSYLVYQNPGKDEEVCKDSVILIIKETMKRISTTLWSSIEKWLDEYLLTDEIFGDKTTKEFWDEKMMDQNCFIFARKAIQMLYTPVNEAAIERIFAQLKLILTSFRKRAKEDLISSLLTIKMHVIFRRKKFKDVFEDTNAVVAVLSSEDIL